MAELDRDDSKRRHSFCQIGIAHGVGHSYSYGYRLASGICWGTVTVSARLGHTKFITCFTDLKLKILTQVAGKKKL